MPDPQGPRAGWSIPSSPGSGRTAPRYETVGKALGTPWYVVGLIHTMEASGNFGAHLHNGDPLSARTTHVPAGRPKTGTPPFTWEESATDALTMQGFPAWKDWSVPGTLYKLEGYNGWGYHDHHPDVNTPYLWSFSNHYTSGEVRRRRDVLGDRGLGAVRRGRAPQAADPARRDRRRSRHGAACAPAHEPVHDRPRRRPRRNACSTTNPYGDFFPGTFDEEYGPITADAAKRAKLALGFPPAKADRTFGPVLRAYLDGSKPLPPAFAARRAKAEQALPAGGEAAIRAQIVQWALWGVKNSGADRLQPGRRPGSARSRRPGSLPLATDCSGFATLCYAWAKAPNPNFDGPYVAAAGGYTGTLLTHCKRIAATAAKPGDLIVWTPPNDGSHVCILVGPGAEPVARLARLRRRPVQGPLRRRGRVPARARSRHRGLPQLVLALLARASRSARRPGTSGSPTGSRAS